MRRRRARTPAPVTQRSSVRTDAGVEATGALISVGPNALKTGDGRRRSTRFASVWKPQTAGNDAQTESLRGQQDLKKAAVHPPGHFLLSRQEPRHSSSSSLALSPQF
ncbi:hypothetical protein VZT92_023727 [Zoarces viviparus]|uniref:Uncharacterized protein n=1 Tax=Zoarces viviparus TaxID=48416 RepID=A0AAW1E752_ZOAVI